MIYAIPLLLIVLWTCFLAYSALKPRWKSLRWEVKLVGGLVVLLGFAIDVLLNWTAGLLLGVTRDMTLSQKCKRLRRDDMGWRGNVAAYICTNWLNPFDNGHC